MRMQDGEVRNIFNVLIPGAFGKPNALVGKPYSKIVGFVNQYDIEDLSRWYQVPCIYPFHLPSAFKS